MWGGVKARKHYGDHFRQWSATKGLEGLRKVLYQEPRPWFLAFSLHQRQHLLPDHHCARLLSWCATVVQLRETREEKLEAYRLAQDTFGMMTHSHKTSREAFFEYMRLCAVGRDLTTAYEWHKYWLDAKVGGGADGASQGGAVLLLQQYAWLLRIALESPSDESAEDMAVAVREGYSDNCCTPMEHEETGERVLAHFQAKCPEEESALRGLFCAFRAIERRLAPRWVGREEGEDDLRGFIAALPVSDAEVQEWLEGGWPTHSPYRNFPHLEGGLKVPQPTPARPCLRDSLLSSALVEKLEHAAFVQRDVSAVISILKWYQECVAMEKERKDSDSRRLHQQKLHGEALDVWRQFPDSSARRLRAPVVEAGGLTPELYHYVISALAHTQPTAALRTLQRMRDASLRTLDVTRAVAIVAAEGAFQDQLRLFSEQLAEIAERRKLDSDFGVTKRVEGYWKYEYATLFHYLNAMDEEAFYAFLMSGLRKAEGESGRGEGPQAVQKLLLASGHCGPTATEEDLVILNDALRRSAARHFRRCLGPGEVETALNLITQHMPKLDISLMGSLPQFSDYTVRDGDHIITDTATLAERMAPYDTVFVLDSSFVETGESFLRLGRGREEGGAGGRTLILVPYVTLAQLAESVESEDTFVTFDPALAEVVKEEPALASQRLRSLYAFVQSPQGTRGTTRRDGGSNGSGGLSSASSLRADVRVLHFTECLLAHGLLPEAAVKALLLSPATSDNDHLILVVALLSSSVKAGTRLVLCSDDPAMMARLTSSGNRAGASEAPSLASLFRVPVEVLGTRPPAPVDVDRGVINDNPVFEFSAEAFVPKLSVSEAMKASATSHESSPQQENAHGTSTASPQLGAEPAAEQTDVSSPWLSLLEEEEEGVDDKDAEAQSAPERVARAAAPLAASPSPLSVPLNPSSPQPASDEKAAADREAELMDLYATPHDVVPIGVAMREASALGNVFSQFDVLEPEERLQSDMDRQARRSQLQHNGSGGSTGKRRRSHLEKDMLDNRGASYKERRRLARHLSNLSGRRVPFNFRYKVVQANVRDPRNTSLRRSFEEGVRRKRESYKKTQL